MKNIPFYLGVLLIIPETVHTDKQAKFPNGIGVAAVMTADSVILHGAIKENIQHQAFLVWVDAQGRRVTHQAALAIEAIINNIRYVSIENTWYSIIREVSKTSLLRKAIAGAGAMVKYNGGRSVRATQRQGAYPDPFPAPVAGTKLSTHTDNNKNNDQPKLVVTVFAETTHLATETVSSEKACPEMAMIVDRFQSLNLP